MTDHYSKNILIVDDTPANLDLLSQILAGNGFRVRSAPSGKLALQAARVAPPDLIMLDVCMPEMDGFDVCRRLKSEAGLKAIPIIFISALNDPLDKVKAFDAGGVDYVTKPFNAAEVLARVNTHLRIHFLQQELDNHNKFLQEKVRAQVQEISDSQMATIYALARLSESRDDATGRHLERVQGYCRLLASALFTRRMFRPELDEEFIERLVKSSPLHDIGKVGIPDGILLKPGRLTSYERLQMQEHTTIGADTLESVQEHYPHNKFIRMGVEIARSHHEKWDGSGYPEGRAGRNIPLCARIMALADVYDALRSSRVYKPPMGHEYSCSIILLDSPGHFDPDILAVFRDMKDQFPGSSGNDDHSQRTRTIQSMLQA